MIRMVEHPVVKTYIVDGIPHYFPIGKGGRIINNNAVLKRMLRY